MVSYKITFLFLIYFKLFFLTLSLSKYEFLVTLLPHGQLLNFEYNVIKTCKVTTLHRYYIF